LKKSLFILLAALIFDQTLLAAALTEKNLNVFSFNIKRNGDLREKALKIARDLNSLGQYKPEFILLQEVKGEDNAGSPEKVLGAALGGYYSNFSSKTGSKKGEGSAIVSKYPFQYYDYKIFSPSLPLKRIAIMGEFAVPGVGLVRIVNVHLSWQPMLEGSRSKQIKTVLDWLQERETKKKADLVFFGGDFNLHPDSSDLRKTLTYKNSPFINLNNPDSDTRGSARVDYIFASTSDHHSVKGLREYVYNNDVSDHKGILHLYSVAPQYASSATPKNQPTNH
jgi:endonuclease/exonuclease/phosphatase family metal-dependent hydrolase